MSIVLQEEVTKETLLKQFDVVEKETTTSHVLQWGQKSIDKQMVSLFVGNAKADLSDFGPFPPETDPCLVS